MKQFAGVIAIIAVTVVIAIFSGCITQTDPLVQKQDFRPATERPLPLPDEKIFNYNTNEPHDLVTGYADKEVFSLTSDAVVEGGTLPAGYTCDGSSSSMALSWTNVPAGTREFALMMTTLPGDGTTKWNWVLYHIPKSTSILARNSSGVGTLGAGSHGSTLAYEPPCSQGPGAKTYTFTVYALSDSPVLPGATSQVTGPLLTKAISSITLGKASLNVSYARPI